MKHSQTCSKNTVTGNIEISLFFFFNLTEEKKQPKVLSLLFLLFKGTSTRNLGLTSLSNTKYKYKTLNSS